MRAYLALASLPLILLTGAIPNPKLPKIKGTYRLVSRDLPDGTKRVPPNVTGLITFTRKYRNFNIYWTGANGKPVSVSNIATYELTEKEYRETNVYFFVNDEAGGKRPTYDLSATSGGSPTTIKGARVEIKLPLHDEPRVVFDGDNMTATRVGAFVDHWMRVR
jgi:hypothetical protein